jgi:hypothetical protein
LAPFATATLDSTEFRFLIQVFFVILKDLFDYIPSSLRVLFVASAGALNMSGIDIWKKSKTAVRAAPKGFGVGYQGYDMLHCVIEWACSSAVRAGDS